MQEGFFSGIYQYIRYIHPNRLNFGLDIFSPQTLQANFAFSPTDHFKSNINNSIIGKITHTYPYSLNVD